MKPNESKFSEMFLRLREIACGHSRPGRIHCTETPPLGWQRSVQTDLWRCGRGLIRLAQVSHFLIYQAPACSTDPRYNPYCACCAGGSAETIPLLVTGPKIFITADTAPGGSVTVSVVGLGECTAVAGRNVTGEFLAGCDLTAHVGKSVTLLLGITPGAALYTLGFHA